MSLIATQGIFLPPPPLYSPSGGFASALINATGQKIAFIGRMMNQARAAKNLTKVGFRFGTVTKAGGSALTVSLQDVDLVGGPPVQPDGTQDQTVAIANADAGFATSTFYKTNAFSASRAMAFGDAVAIVIEFDGSGRLGADAVNITSLGTPGTAVQNLGGGVMTYNGSAWSQQGVIPNILLEFDDGTFGTLAGMVPLSANGNVAYNSGSSPDEYALEFTVPFPARVEGAWAIMQAASGADFEFDLYNGTTLIASMAQDGNAIIAAAARTAYAPFAGEAYVVPGNTYRLALKPTTANNVTLYHSDVAAAGHFDAWPLGNTAVLNSRTDGGAWGAAIATRRPYMGLMLSALSDGGIPASRVQLGM
jgi:hypothetical protein